MNVARLCAIALTTLLAAPVMAQQCETQIEGNDQMKFNKTSLEIPASCKEYKVTLKHVGKLPKAAMGHNWVLTKTSDMQPVVAASIKAGAANDYLPKGDARVLAHTKMLGGGESDTVTVDVSKLQAGADYTFFCSFPGHSSLMKGTLKVAK
ncbi:MAG: azurin [Burkholderiaceae bacterium]|nr:azurin [Burkholderiaceae bacterium]